MASSTSDEPVPVSIVASKPLRVGQYTYVMFADFGEGMRYSLGAGENRLRIPPGTYRLRMYSELGPMRVAKAELAVDVGAEPLTIYYAAPYTVFNRGVIGWVPQRRPWRALLGWVLAGAVSAALIGFVVGLLA